MPVRADPAFNSALERQDKLGRLKRLDQGDRREAN